MKELTGTQITTRSATVWTQTIADAKDKRDAAVAMAEHDYRSDFKVQEAKASLEHYAKSHRDAAFEQAVKTGHVPCRMDGFTKQFMQPRKVKATAEGIKLIWISISSKKKFFLIVPWSAILPED